MYETATMIGSAPSRRSVAVAHPASRSLQSKTSASRIDPTAACRRLSRLSRTSQRGSPAFQRDRGALVDWVTPTPFRGGSEAHSGNVSTQRLAADADAGQALLAADQEGVRSYLELGRTRLQRADERRAQREAEKAVTVP